MYIAANNTTQLLYKQNKAKQNTKMESRKRQSDTAVVVPQQREMMQPPFPKTTTRRLQVRIKRFHGVAKWTWNAGSEDEVCGICQSPFEGVAPGAKFPGDECPVVFGKCGHGTQQR